VPLSGIQQSLALVASIVFRGVSWWWWLLVLDVVAETATLTLVVVVWERFKRPYRIACLAPPTSLPVTSQSCQFEPCHRLQRLDERIVIGHVPVPGSHPKYDSCVRSLWRQSTGRSNCGPRFAICK
jgi:hypothetical protein